MRVRPFIVVLQPLPQARAYGVVVRPLQQPCTQLITVGWGAAFRPAGPPAGGRGPRVA